ncbi:MAG: S9 family peptidase, partial [Acidobacteriota bacterium]
MYRFWLAPLVAIGLAAQPAPKTRTDNVKEVIHGVEIVDPYRWLEDQNSPETRAWIEAQNAHSRPLLDAVPGREALKRRLTELMKIDVTGVPRERGGRYFFSRKLASQDQFVLYVRRGLRGKDEVLIDPHPWSPDYTVSVSLREVSEDGRLIAYGVRQGGEDEVEIRLMDVDSRKDLPDRLAKGRYFGVSIKPDKSGFYYSRHGKEGSRIYYHAMGRDPAGDAEIFGKGYGPDKGVSARLSDDGRYLVISVSYGSSGDRSDIFFQDLSAGGPIQPLVKDEAAGFFGDVAGDRMFLRTNWKAPNWRVLAVDLKNPARANWREVIPEAKSVLEGLSLAGGRLCASYLENVNSRVRIFDAQGKHVRDVVFSTLGTVGGPGGRWGSTEAFYTFSSFHVPGAIYRYDVASGREEVWWRPNIPFRSDALELKQVWYESRDGTRIPMFVLHRKG